MRNERKLSPTRKPRILKILMKKRLVMFDFDGTLVDSEGYWRQSAIRLLCEKGIEIPECFFEDYDKLMFTAGLKMIDLDKENADRIGMTLAERKSWAFDNMAKLYLTSVKLKKGAAELVRRTHELGIAAVIVTASRGKDVEAATEHYGFADCIREVISVVDNPKRKESPAVYLEICERYGVTPAEALLIDDKSTALAAAREAGMSAFGVFDRSKEKKIEETKAACDAYFYTPEDIIPALEELK